ncbi:MAG: PD40 domain-containing protein [Bacteroidia bacterium]|nr:PD40 domain-containing protein [Bacteroidia bacterium]
MKKVSAIFLIVLMYSVSFAQQTNYTSKIKEAVNLYERAERAYSADNLYAAKIDITNAIKIDTTFMEAYMLLGELLGRDGKYEETLSLYLKAIKINGDAYPLSYVLLGSVQFYLQKYEDAKASYTKYLTFQYIKPGSKEVAEFEIKRCDFRINTIKNPVPFIPKNLGPNVNSAYDEYLPALTADEQTLVITVRLPRENVSPNSKNKFNEDFFVCRKTDGKWQIRETIGDEINTPNNEGAQSVSADGQTLYYTACEKSGGYGGCDIFYSKRVGDTWSKPINIGSPINTESWESQPSISSDGKTLYFASDRPGGYGELDIWKSSLDVTGKWTNPINIGPQINTSATEMSPFIHPDNTTLYFASDGWIGMGGLDLFMSQTDEKGAWTEPMNLGYPINSSQEETSLIVNATGDKAYFSSKRDDTYGGMDLYEFELYKEARPIPVTYVKGKVFDAATKAGIEAKFELIDLETTDIEMEAVSNSGTGEFLVSLPTNRNYALNVSKKGYLFYSENFSLKNRANSSKPYQIDIPLQAIKVGDKIILNNIFFETNSYVLKNESKVELNKIIGFMKENNTVKIELSGHTDNTGSKDLNKKLSENRAKAVYDYLVNNSISSGRLRFKGYADMQPVAQNTTTEGKAKNRRTELKIIE